MMGKSRAATPKGYSQTKVYPAKDSVGLLRALLDHQDNFAEFWQV
jgi:hypothetical protein